jgi:acyl-CoA dehydrogenase
MDFKLDARHEAARKQAQHFAAVIAPIAAEADEMSEVHQGVLEALGASGLCELMVPAEFGGRYERIDPLAICLVREVLMGTSAHADALFALQGIGSYAISVAGSAEQRKLWLPGVATGEYIAALALTEPDTGSDLKALATRATATDEGLSVSGEKSFISNAGAADIYLVLAREEEGFSLLLIPADLPGISISPTPEIIAPHVLGEMKFDQVQLPADARLGHAGRGFDLVLATLAVFRVSVAGAALGLAQAALNEAIRHTNAREQFGRPLSRLGPVAQMLADCATEIEMARWMTYRAATEAADDPAASLHYSSMAKLGASEMAGRVVDRCVQVMGRFGLIRGSRIEALYRQARPMRIYEGSSEVLRQSIARKLCETRE